MKANDRFIRMAQVCDMVGLKRAAIYKRIAKGAFPNSISIGGQSIRFLESDILDWMSKQI